MANAVFLQARLGSSRLPHKILLNLGGRTVIEQIIQRLSLVECDYHVILCDEMSFPILNEIATMMNWECFPGPENDVLARFALAAQHYDVTNIVRATGDNPFVSYELANMLINQQEINEIDYRAHIEIPYGAGVEVIPRETLELVSRITKNHYDREHVCPYLYNNEQQFVIQRDIAPVEYQNPNLRISIDNEEDYHFIASLIHTHGIDALDPLPRIIQSMYALAV